MKRATRVLEAARSATRKILGPRFVALVKPPFRSKLAGLSDYRSELRSKRGLEIGGPSAMFTRTGPIPIYDVLGSLDNCLYSTSTIWTGSVREGGAFLYQPGQPPGTQIICDATDLGPLRDFSYECVLACHCLEHVANPFRALAEWKRILTNNGLLFLILPHKDGTFDWRRPTTSLAHMIDDYKSAVGEDDGTHIAEVLRFHDLSKDEGAGTEEQFRQRCLANHLHRAMHHHVFDTMAALAAVDHAGFQVVRVDNLKPYHIIILARRQDGPVDNHRFMQRGGEHWKRSPFPSDREHANR